MLQLHATRPHEDATRARLTRLVVVCATALLLLVWLAEAATAHEGDTLTAEDHAQQDAVTTTLAQERDLERSTEAATEADATAAAATVTGNRGSLGQWGPKQPWDVVGVHVALLPSGKVLAYDSVGDLGTESYDDHTTTRAMVWDPKTGAQTSTPVAGFNLFCSGLAHLPDGRVYLAGGNKDKFFHGIEQTYVFDETTRWTREGDMALPRWYPSVTPQPDGEMLITSGYDFTDPAFPEDMPEVRGVDGKLRRLPGAARNIPLYPWMDVAPNGKTFYSGPDPGMRTLDKDGAGSWKELGQRDGTQREYGSHVMFDIGKIMVAGGDKPATRTARTIDLNGTGGTMTATSKSTDDMANARRQHNLTVLADGSVLASGGFSGSNQNVDLDKSVYTPELWNPTTGQWRTLEAADQTRQYHSSALLLPDGRVLASGGGVCGDCVRAGYLAKNGEVFSPPYLFDADGSPAARPVITAAPAAATYGGALRFKTSGPAVAKAALVRLGSNTHSVDMEQRYVPLTIASRSGSTVTAIGPATANIAPPGVYMLFALDAKGVPSESRMVRIQPGTPPNTPPSVDLTAPSNGQTAVAPATVDLAAEAFDFQDAAVKVEFYDGTTKLGEDTSEPYTHRWVGASVGEHRLTARAIDSSGLVRTSPARTFTVITAPAPAPGGGPVTPGSPPVTVGDPPTAPVTPTDAGPGSQPPATTPPGSGQNPTTTRRLPVLLRDLVVVGTKSSTRRLRFVLARPATVRLTLLRQRAGRWSTLPGTRSVRLQAGGRSISLRTPWAGRRLVSGRYRAAVRAGSVLRTVTFTVR